MPDMNGWASKITKDVGVNILNSAAAPSFSGNYADAYRQDSRATVDMSDTAGYNMGRMGEIHEEFSKNAMSFKNNIVGNHLTKQEMVDLYDKAEAAYQDWHSYAFFDNSGEENHNKATEDKWNKFDKLRKDLQKRQGQRKEYTTKFKGQMSDLMGRINGISTEQDIKNGKGSRPNLKMSAYTQSDTKYMFQDKDFSHIAGEPAAPEKIGNTLYMDAINGKRTSLADASAENKNEQPPAPQGGGSGTATTSASGGGGSRSGGGSTSKGGHSSSGSRKSTKDDKGSSKDKGSSSSSKSDSRMSANEIFNRLKNGSEKSTTTSPSDSKGSQDGSVSGRDSKNGSTGRGVNVSGASGSDPTMGTTPQGTQSSIGTGTTPGAVGANSGVNLPGMSGTTAAGSPSMAFMSTNAPTTGGTGGGKIGDSSSSSPSLSSYDSGLSDEGGSESTFDPVTGSFIPSSGLGSSSSGFSPSTSSSLPSYNSGSNNSSNLGGRSLSNSEFQNLLNQAKQSHSDSSPSSKSRSSSLHEPSSRHHDTQVRASASPGGGAVGDSSSPSGTVKNVSSAGVGESSAKGGGAPRLGVGGGSSSSGGAVGRGGMPMMPMMPPGGMGGNNAGGAGSMGKNKIVEKNKDVRADDVEASDPVANARNKDGVDKPRF